MTLAVPPVRYPPDLPVSRMRDEIAAAIRDHQVVVVAGETGSGKTTQLPKICLELGRTAVAHTQPRRIAARTVAERIAEELDVELGTLVGYSVRFTDRSSAETRIRIMTDGILLAEIHRDRELRRYDTIILDEAHERSLNIDFLLGYLKRLLPRRPDLKVIITSATIEVDRFAAHFAGPGGDPAPVLQVSGRTYPVEIRYRPLVPEAGGDDVDEEAPGAGSDGTRSGLAAVPGDEGAAGPADPGDGAALDLGEGVAAALDELERDLGGDVLVFLSGESEIRDVADVLRGRYAGEHGGVTEVLPLYGRLSAADQHRVFERSRTPGVKRRIVLATNVAETSLTVPGIRGVVDAGTARISRYSTRAKVQRLPIEPISQASANQRAGRAGRTSAGIAIRLYSEADFVKRPEYTDPEILRTNLAAVLLQMLSLGLGDLTAFPFLQPPDTRGVRAAADLLRELGALSADGTGLTRVGRDLARLPVDPRFGRMLLESRRHGVTREVLAIVAGLTVQDPRERPLDAREQADEAHRRFADPTSDLITLLNLWNHLERERAERSSSAFRRMCRAEHLNHLRVREWQDLVQQLTRIAKDVKLPVEGGSGGAPDADRIHRSMLAGLLSQIGLRDDRTTQGRGSGQQRRGTVEFAGARQVRFALFPGSTLAKKPPRAVMSAELVETSRLFARMNAAIDPAWAEPIAGDLVRRNYGEPRWDARRGSAVVEERVTLFGVPIVEGRRTQLGRIDPAGARELLIEHALVAGDWPRAIERDRLYDFDRANRRLLADVGREAERTRTALDLESAATEFWESRIPPSVTCVRDLETWWRDERAERPDLLTMTRDDLLPPEQRAAADERAYPRTWQQGDQRLRLRYRFAPGSPDDGVTAVVPLPLLAQLSPVGFDWQVPGLREELVTALLRALPKGVRRSVVPAADWAQRLLADLPPGPETGAVPPPLVDALSAAIRVRAGAVARPEDFDVARVPAHLRIAFEVQGDEGRVLGRDPDLAGLQRRLAAPARAAVAAVASDAGAVAGGSERTGLTTFDLDEVPRVVDVRRAGGVVRAYPALVDTGRAVDLRLLASPEEQATAMRRGLVRLLLLATPSPVGYVRQHLSAAEKLALGASPYPSTDALFEDCLIAVVERVLHREGGLVWSRTDFERVRQALSGRVLDDLFGVVAATAAALAAAREADAAITDAAGPDLLPSLRDARAQLDALVHPGFVAIDGADRLPRLAVYLRGITFRIERLPGTVNRDRVRMSEADTATAEYRAAGGALPLTAATPPELAAVRWLLEEFRLSLFAQQLGTAAPVSLPRIRRALAAISAGTVR
jgi:ATP-dependent helicase HrpA